MLAGHYATALVANQHAPRGHIAYYLVASQLPDLLWLIFHYLGLEPTEPDNMMAVSLDTMHVEMTYSHDVLPMLAWIALTVVVGRAIAGSWRPGWIGGALVVVHAITDYLGGFPHNVFGPDSHAVGTGLYYTAPYLAVALEGAFALAVLAWVVRHDAKAGLRRSRGTLKAWVAVFGGGVAFLLLSADLSMAELVGVEPSAALSGTTVPMLATTYLSMIAALIWGEAQPKSSTKEVAAPSSAPAR